MPDHVQPGEAFASDWTPTQRDFDRFARISGDDNPIHVDAAFAARTRFGRTVAHGMLLYGRLWAQLRRRYPELRPAGHQLMFPTPAFDGEALRFSVAVEGGEEDRRLTVAVSAVRVADGAEVLTGRIRLARTSP